MESRVDLRPLTGADASDLAALEADIFADSWDASRFVELLASKRFVAFGAVHGTELLAYVTAYSIDGELEIVNVAVRENMRGYGLGTRLVANFLEQARACGVRRVVLEVRAGNAAALALYTRVGFVSVGVRKGYYATPVEDALILAWTPSSEAL